MLSAETDMIFDTLRDRTIDSDPCWRRAFMYSIIGVSGGCASRHLGCKIHTYRSSMTTDSLLYVFSLHLLYQPCQEFSIA